MILIVLFEFKSVEIELELKCIGKYISFFCWEMLYLLVLFDMLFLEFKIDVVFILGVVCFLVWNYGLFFL